MLSSGKDSDVEQLSRSLEDPPEAASQSGQERFANASSLFTPEARDILHFVINDVKAESDATMRLEALFSELTSQGVCCRWISHLECFKVTETSLCAFIVDPFSGPAFNHLVQVKCRVFGPLVVHECWENGKPLPKQPHPVYSSAMRAVRVACTNLPSAVRDQIFKKVEMMSGHCSKDLTKSVTHLIVGSVGSKKYHMSIKFNLPVMKVSWVESIWEYDQYLSDREPTDTYYDTYRASVFQGLCICVSQISSEERRAIQSLVEQNGGRYSGALKSNDVTHLVLLYPEGNKYMYAVSWKLHCVKPEWVYKSLETGYCKDENLYRLPGEGSLPKVSTPRKSSFKPNLDAEISKISSVSVSCLEETTRLEYVTLQDDLHDETLLPTKTDKGSDRALHPLDYFDVSLLINCKKFLNGCRVVVTGFNNFHSRRLSQIIHRAGGTEFSKYSEGVTHVICAKDDVQSLFSEDMISGPVRPCIVSCQWLIDCVKQQMMIDENPYCMGQGRVILPDQAASQVSEEKENNFTGSSAKKSESQKIKFVHGVSSVMKECFPSNDNENCVQNDNSAEERESVQQNDSGELKVKQGTDVQSVNESEISAPQKPENKEFGNSPTEYQEDEEYLSFEGVKFVVVGFGPKDTEILTDLILSREGDAYDSNAKCHVDIAVVPVFWDVQSVNAKRVVTNCWLQSCIENEKLLPCDENPLFKPLCVLPPCSKPLHDCVISMSQYSGVERDCLRHIAEVLGATCQEYFVRKTSRKKDLLPNTHLIVAAPEGSKFEAAKRWNIPAVTKQWLIDAAKTGRLPATEMYLAVGGALKNQNFTSVVEDACEQYQSARSGIGVPDKPQIDPGAVSLGGPEKHATEAACGNEEKGRHEKKASGNRQSPLNTTFLNPKIAYHPDFDVSEMLDALESPCGSGDDGRSLRKESISLTEMFSHNLSIALERFSRPLRETESCVPKTSKCFDRFLRESPSNIRPLKGVILCVSKKLASLQAELHRAVASLGGEYCENYNSRCTHFVFLGKSYDLNREFRLARREEKIIVAPDWVISCKNAKKRVDESLYPHTYKSKMIVDEVSSLKRQSPSSNGNSTSSTDVKEDCDDPSGKTQKLDVDRQLDKIIGEVQTVTSRNGNKSSNPNSPKRQVGSFKQNAVLNLCNDGQGQDSGTMSTVLSVEKDPQSPAHVSPIAWGGQIDKDKCNLQSGV